MTNGLHVDLHLRGPLDSLPVIVLTIDSGPFAALDIPAGEGTLSLFALDPADFRTLAAACERAASELEARLNDRYAASEPAALAGGEGTA